MMSRFDSWHWNISTDCHFQNGRHNTAQIQHCPMSTPFHMWVDYDVPNRFLTLKNFYRSPFSKWPPQYRTISTSSDFNDISYVGRLWCPEFIPDIEKFLAAAIFKMAAKIQHCPISSKIDMWVDNDVPNLFPTLKNFYRLPFSKWPPQYRNNSTLSDII
jgi:hypothetical protein